MNNDLRERLARLFWLIPPSLGRDSDAGRYWEPEHDDKVAQYRHGIWRARREESLCVAGEILAALGEDVILLDRARWERVLADAREWRRRCEGYGGGPVHAVKPGDLEDV